jgi:hypothetical protein
MSFLNVFPFFKQKADIMLLYICLVKSYTSLYTTTRWEWYNKRMLVLLSNVPLSLLGISLLNSATGHLGDRVTTMVIPPLQPNSSSIDLLKGQSPLDFHPPLLAAPVPTPCSGAWLAVPQQEFWQVLLPRPRCALLFRSVP